MASPSLVHSYMTGLVPARREQLIRMLSLKQAELPMVTTSIPPGDGSVIISGGSPGPVVEICFENLTHTIFYYLVCTTFGTNLQLFYLK